MIKPINAMQHDSTPLIQKSNGSNVIMKNLHDTNASSLKKGIKRCLFLSVRTFVRLHRNEC